MESYFKGRIVEKTVLLVVHTAAQIKGFVLRNGVNIKEIRCNIVNAFPEWCDEFYIVPGIFTVFAEKNMQSALLPLSYAVSGNICIFQIVNKESAACHVAVTLILQQGYAHFFVGRIENSICVVKKGTQLML